MSHSLKTPLSQIEVALKLLTFVETLSSEDREAVERARSSVAVCKAYIQAFRQAVLAEDHGSAGSSDSLKTILASTARTGGVPVDIEIPNKIAGYSNAFILAMLVPLIDNAVESARAGSIVTLKHSMEENKHIFDVRNTPSAPLPTDPYAAGVSTKDGHDGMGLVVVKRLINSVPGAALSHRMEQNDVVFAISLPGKSS